MSQPTYIDHIYTTLRQNRRTIPVFFLIGLLLFVVFGWLWWSRVYNSPQNAFWDMLDESLKTSGVTRQVKQDDGSNTLEQYVRLQLGSEPFSRSMSTVIQQESEASASTVRTETIGTQDVDYSRYTLIETQQKNSAGQTYDFSNVLNTWSKGTPEEASGFDEALLGVVPVGSLTAKQRKQMINFIQDAEVYTVDFTKTERTREDGRPVLVYTVAVDPQAYIKMLQEFVKQLGIEVAGLDPSAYEGSEAVTMEFSVDTRSHLLRRITYASNNREERYVDYGLRDTLSLPAQTISSEELQTRLQTIQ